MGGGAQVSSPLGVIPEGDGVREVESAESTATHPGRGRSVDDAHAQTPIVTVIRTYTHTHAHTHHSTTEHLSTRAGLTHTCVGVESAVRRWSDEDVCNELSSVLRKLWHQNV